MIVKIAFEKSAIGNKIIFKKDVNSVIYYIRNDIEDLVGFKYYCCISSLFSTSPAVSIGRVGILFKNIISSPNVIYVIG